MGGSFCAGRACLRVDRVLSQVVSGEGGAAAGGQVAISKVAPSRLWCRRRSGWWASRYIKSCPKSPLVQEAQRLVGKSLYQKLPQVVSSSIHGGASGGWAGRYIKCCPNLWPALDVRGVSVLYLLREGAEIFVCCLEMCVMYAHWRVRGDTC